MKLEPSAALFSRCYSGWLSNVADLMLGSPAGVTFGLFGRWGSGKSSACLALEPLIYRSAQAAGRIYQCVTVNAFQLRLYDASQQGKLASEAIRNAVVLDVKPHLLSTSRRRKVYEAIATIAPIFKLSDDAKVLTDPLVVLSKAAVRETEKEDDRVLERAKGDLDRIIVFIDDLDRCDPAESLRILAAINDRVALPDTNVVVATDPFVLSSHVAKQFGVDEMEARQAISKYIQVPLWVPTGPAVGHISTIKEHLHPLKAILPGDQFREIIVALLQGTGAVPIREFLACIPQAVLWVKETLEIAEQVKAKTDVPAIARAAMILSLFANLFPDFVRWGLDETVPIHGYLFGQLAEKPKRDRSGFAALLESFLASRPGLSWLMNRWGGQLTADAFHLTTVVALGVSPTLAGHGDQKEVWAQLDTEIADDGRQTPAR